MKLIELVNSKQQHQQIKVRKIKSWINRVATTLGFELCIKNEEHLRVLLYTLVFFSLNERLNHTYMK